MAYKNIRGIYNQVNYERTFATWLYNIHFLVHFKCTLGVNAGYITSFYLTRRLIKRSSVNMKGERGMRILSGQSAGGWECALDAKEKRGDDAKCKLRTKAFYIR